MTKIDLARIINSNVTIHKFRPAGPWWIYGPPYLCNDNLRFEHLIVPAREYWDKL